MINVHAHSDQELVLLLNNKTGLRCKDVNCLSATRIQCSTHIHDKIPCHLWKNIPDPEVGKPDRYKGTQLKLLQEGK